MRSYSRVRHVFRSCSSSAVCSMQTACGAKKLILQNFFAKSVFAALPRQFANSWANCLRMCTACSQSTSSTETKLRPLGDCLDRSLRDQAITEVNRNFCDGWTHRSSQGIVLPRKLHNLAKLHKLRRVQFRFDVCNLLRLPKPFAIDESNRNKSCDPSAIAWTGCYAA